MVETNQISPTEPFLYENIGSSIEKYSGKEARVAALLEKRYGLSTGSVVLDVFGNHVIRRERILSKCQGTFPTVITGELSPPLAQGVLLGTFEISSNLYDPDLIKLGVGDTKENLDAHVATVKELYPDTTFITADGMIYFDTQNGLRFKNYKRILFDLGSASFLMSSFTNLASTLSLALNKERSRRAFLKSTIAALMLGAGFRSAGVQVRKFEKADYLQYHELVIFLRNLIMVQNFGNILTAIESDTKTLFFSANGHSGVLELFKEDPANIRKTLKAYCQDFIEKVFTLTKKESDTSAAIGAFSFLSELFSQPVAAGNYVFNLEVDAVQPSAMTIFINALIEKIQMSEGEERDFFIASLYEKLYMNSFETVPLSTTNLYTKDSQYLKQAISYAVTFEDDTGKYSLPNSEGRQVFVGVAEIAGKSYPMIEDSDSGEKRIQMAPDLAFPI